MSEVTLAEGGGGKEMDELIRSIRERLDLTGEWENISDDSASSDFNGKLLFTSDSYIVTPLFFPGGDIGKIAICGTINDLVVMGAEPTGISLSLVIEEGFSKDKLFKIIDSINDISKATGIPIVTGDTKVMERGKIDKLAINTSGVGYAKNVLDRSLSPGDSVIVSGGLGEHGSALLSKRFNLESNLKSDCKPLVEEMATVRDFIKQAKDVTRGGLAAILNELSRKNDVQMEINDEDVPFKQEVKTITNLLGIDPYSLACEGIFVCISKAEYEEEVLEKLKQFNPDARVIGHVTEGSGVIVQTRFGKRLMPIPSGVIVPRIC